MIKTMIASFSTILFGLYFGPSFATSYVHINDVKTIGRTIVQILRMENGVTKHQMDHELKPSIPCAPKIASP